MTDREVLELAGGDEISHWLAALTDARDRTLALVGRLSDPHLDRGEPNTIGSTLYHLAAIEADWLYDDMRGEPDEIPMHLFPFDVREEGGLLTPISDMSLSEHLNRLATIRRALVDYVSTLDAESFQRPLSRADYDVAPAYVLHHLLQHEAEHRAEIGRALRS